MQNRMASQTHRVGPTTPSCLAGALREDRQICGFLKKLHFFENFVPQIPEM